MDVTHRLKSSILPLRGLLSLLLATLLLSACGKDQPPTNSKDDFTFQSLSSEMPIGDWNAIKEVFSQSNEIRFGEVWEEAPSPNYRDAKARILWQPDGLWILAELEDDDMHNAAQKTNDFTWEMGDIFEIFLVTPGSERYLELHVTPDNVHLQIVWPHFQKINELRAKGVKALDYMNEDSLFSSWVKVDHENHRWTILAKVKAKAITDDGLLKPGIVLKTSFARYDTFQDSDQIIFSSSSPHKKINYHIQSDWKDYQLLP